MSIRSSFPLILLTGCYSLWASDASYSFMGLDEVHMSGAGIALQGSPGSVITNPANLGFVGEVDRYYSMLRVIRYQSREIEVDSPLLLVPALAERTFPLAGGVAAVYGGSMEINFQSGFREIGLDGETFVRAQIIRGGFAWGKRSGELSWGGSLFGISTYTAASYVNSSADTLSSGRTTSNDVSVGMNLGVSRMMPWGGWGIKLLPTVQPIQRRNHNQVKVVSTSGDFFSFQDSQTTRARRPTELGLGLRIKLPGQRQVFLDASGGAKDYANRSTDFSVFRLGYSGSFSEKSGLLLGCQYIPLTRIGEDGLSPDTFGASFGVKNKAKNSVSTIGLSYKQDHRGLNRTFALNFGSEFEI